MMSGHRWARFPASIGKVNLGEDAGDGAEEREEGGGTVVGAEASSSRVVSVVGKGLAVGVLWFAPCRCMTHTRKASGVPAGRHSTLGGGVPRGRWTAYPLGR